MSSEAPELDALQSQCSHVELRRSAGDIYWCDHCAKPFRLTSSAEREIAHWKQARQEALDAGDVLKETLAERDAEIERLRNYRAECEKWKGLALAKHGDGRTLNEIQRELAERDAEIERLRAEVSEYKERWAREFELRGDLAATIERRIADASQRARLPEELVNRIFDQCEQYGVLKESLWADHADELFHDILAAVEQKEIK